MDVTFVIPVKDEEKSVHLLYQEITENIQNFKKSYEIIFIDDGSKDNTFYELKLIQKKDKLVKVVSLRGNYGKSVALQIGFERSEGDIVFTLDGDLQDNPSEIGAFLSKIEEGYDLVSGWKKNRHDPMSKVLPSRIFNNFLIPLLTGVRLHDINCGFKAYRKEVVKMLNLYGELYRFIPVFAQKQNFKVTEIVVDHRSRKYGKTKYGWDRNFKGLLDLLTVSFLTGYLSRPGHFFGSLGLVSLGTGFIIGLYITYLRVTTGSIQYRQPLLFLGILLMIIGIQLISTGLLAEMIAYSKSKTDAAFFIREIVEG